MTYFFLGLLIIFSSRYLQGQEMLIEGTLQVESDFPDVRMSSEFGNRTLLRLTSVNGSEMAIWAYEGALRLGSGSNGQPSTKIYVAPDGKIGMGTLGPERRLHIVDNGGMLRLEGSSNAYLTFYDDNSLDGAIGYGVGGNNQRLYITNYNQGLNDQIVLQGGNGGQLRLYPDGKLYANNLGNIGDHKNMQWDETTGEIGWDNSSRRYKSNIQTLHDDWSKIFQARPVKYTRPRSPDRWEYGYVAEEIDSIGLTNLVGYDAKGIPDDVKYDRIVIYLTELVKQQSTEIKELKQMNKSILCRLSNVERNQNRKPRNKRSSHEQRQ